MHEVKQRVKNALCAALKCEEADLKERMRGYFKIPEDRSKNMEWMPIETAPMDGTEVLLGEQDSADYELARYNDDMGLWLDRCSDKLHFTPTHWLDPMPPHS